MPIPAVKARQNFSAKNERSGRKSRKKDKLRKEKPKKSAFTDNNKDAYLSVIRCQIYVRACDIKADLASSLLYRKWKQMETVYSGLCFLAL